MIVVFNLKNKISIPLQYELLDYYNKDESNEIEFIVAPVMPVDNREYNFNLAFQNISIKDRCVGELSSNHFKYYNTNYSFVGHLERRLYLNENEDIVREKLLNSLDNNIIPILCIGYANDNVLELINLLKDINLEGKRIIVAYEVLSATVNGLKDYDYNDIGLEYQKIREVLLKLKEEFADFNFNIIFGGGLERDDLPKIYKLGFDGILVGDRIEVQKSIYDKYIRTT